MQWLETKMKYIFTALYLFIIIITMQLCRLNRSAFAQEHLELDISEVTILAIENNFDIQIYKLDQAISEKDLLKAQSVYDTSLDASYEYNENRLDNAFPFSGTRATTVLQEGSLSKKLPTGTMLSAGLEHVRQSTNSEFSTIDPYHESSAKLSITQPLARNFLGIIDRNTVKITGLDVENTGYTSLDKIEKELADSQKAYWRLLLAYKDLRLTEDILANTKSLFAANKLKYDIGIVEAPEFYGVEADLNQKKNNVLLANDYLNSALNNLRLKLNLDKDVLIMPKDDFICPELKIKFEDVIKTALNNRRDYKTAKNNIKKMSLYVEMKKNALWPQIDIKGTFKKNGLDQKFANSIKEITSQDNPEYAVAVIFSFPLENSQARAEYTQKELEKARALVELKKIECLVFVQVNDAFFHANRMYDSVKLLRIAADFEHKKFLGEEDRFNKGRSDTDRLLRYQNDYLSAEVRYLRSLYDYKEAIINLNVVMNNLLKTCEEQI
jgi:outer membrane protein TolC